MDLVITNAGLIAANNAGLFGPRINVDTVKLSSDNSVPVDVSRTDVSAPIVDTLPITFFNVLSANLIEYVIILDESLGDYDIEEIGLFLDSGELFAIGQPGVPISKIATVGPSLGNRLTLNLRVQFNNITNILDFTLVNSPTAQEWANNFQTATFVSATELTVSGDQTSDFHPGRRVRAVLNSATVYSHVDTSVFGGVDTTITILDSVLDGTLTQVDHGILSSGADIHALPRVIDRLNLTDLSVTDALAATLGVTGDRINIANTFTVPTSAHPGSVGDISYDGTYLYVCTAANFWQRIALSGAF